jgi:DNA invertase Pin-like site-specific DNA recombinase
MDMKMEIKKVGIYARVSTNQQDCENQLIELRRFSEARGWQVIEFVDKGMSGTLDENKRPALNLLLDAARKRKIDGVLVWDFSRFARSMRQLVEALDKFRTWNVAFISLREGVDTTTANGRLMFGIFASLAEFERELIRERVLLGLNRARKAGKVLGRPKLAVDQGKVVKLMADGQSHRAIARMLGISKDTVRNLMQVAKNPLPNGMQNPMAKSSLE